MEYSSNIFIIVALMLSVFSILIKLILKTNGYYVRWYTASVSDIRNLWSLVIKKETSSGKLIYLFIAIVYPLLILSFITYEILHVNGF